MLPQLVDVALLGYGFLGDVVLVEVVLGDFFFLVFLAQTVPLEVEALKGQTVYVFPQEVEIPRAFIGLVVRDAQFLDLVLGQARTRPLRVLPSA